MVPIEPAYSAGVLLLIAAAAVALLLFLIMKVKLHAFVSLVLVSVITAVAAGIPIAEVPNALLTGFSGVFGSVALLVGFGVMIGRLLEATGGAQVLADTLVTLPTLVAREAVPSLHFWFATFSGLRRELFPRLAAARDAWLESGSLEGIREAAEAGRGHWLRVAGEMAADGETARRYALETGTIALA